MNILTFIFTVIADIIIIITKETIGNNSMKNQLCQFMPNLH